jgi:hypothetical protein
MTIRVPVLFSLVSLVFGLTARGTVQPQDVPAGEFVRRVVTHESKAEEQDQSNWLFRLDIERPNGQKEVDEVVETKQGDLTRPILINGRELTAEERQKADKRLQQIARNPGALQKSLNDKNQDAARSRRLLKMLPDAFLFNYGERKGDLQQLDFSPNPHFRPSSHEAEVFHAMEGSIRVDTKQERVAEISGHLIHTVKFGGGLLGHLDQGGTFEVRQAEVAPGYWELTALNVHMKGKALFFKTISVQQYYSRSELKLVPQDLTVAQGIDILRHAASTNRQQDSRR